MLLLTAFEPFDSTGINSSLETLREVERRNINSSALATAVLPVRFGDDVKVLCESIEKTAPEAILLLGQSSRARVEVERIAVNLKMHGDRHNIIVSEAPVAYWATWPVEELLQLWKARNLPAMDSAHAGTFLCNHIFFHSLHLAATEQKTWPIAFVHLPRLPNQVSRLDESLPLETLVDCVQIAVEQILSK